MTAGRSPNAVAAVDIGSNSIKLVVRRGSERVKYARTVRLGEGVGRTKQLQSTAIDRAVAALAEYASIARDHGVESLAAVATSATRDASNRNEFLDRAHDALGTRPVVLSGEEEGRLAYLGSCQDLPDGVGSPRLVIDIGGGSTEFVLGADHVLDVQSLDVGCVRLTESHLRSDPPRADELSNAIGHVTDHFEDVLRAVPTMLDTASIVGLGGTITTVAAVEIGRMDLDELHGFYLTRPAAEDVFRTLATERLDDRRHNPGLPADRASVIVGGACVLVAVLRRLKADGLYVAQRSLADGVCAVLRSGTWSATGPATGSAS